MTLRNALVCLMSVTISTAILVASGCAPIEPDESPSPAMSESALSEAQTEPDPNVAPPTDEAPCLSAVIEGQCGSKEKWYAIASQKCAAQGLELQDFEVFGACDKPSFAASDADVPNKPSDVPTGWSGVEFVCCPPQPEPPCHQGKLDGDCLSEKEWYALAHDKCVAHGLVLTEFSVGEPCCEDKFSAAKFQCCPPPCTTSGHHGACLTEAQWTTIAQEECAAQGLVLSQIGFGDPCCEDSFEAMKFECCPGPHADDDAVAPPTSDANATPDAQKAAGDEAKPAAD